jgi:hypothetical protein
VIGQPSITLSSTERDAALFMTLEGIAVSDQAKSFVKSIGLALMARKDPPKLPIASRLSALGAIICDLVRHRKTASAGYSFRPISAGSFTGLAIGYRPFKWAFEELQRHTMMEVALGHQQWTSFAGTSGGPRIRSWSAATRMRASDWLLAKAADCNITPANWSDHFELVSLPVSTGVSHPLVWSAQGAP